MRGQGTVIDTVRALFEWAGDTDRGGLLPESSKNPFLRSGEARSVLRGDPLAEPDITMPMAADFLRACDDFELGVFAPLICFGLRASEPCYLFREHLLDEWLLVPNVPELDYATKGRRDKRFPLPAVLEALWDRLGRGCESGLLLVRRAVVAGRERPPHLGMPVPELQAIYRERIAREQPSPRGRVRLRNGILADAGALTYGEIQRGFHRVAGRLGWPSTATVKDFRHLFATTLANAGLPEGYRKYLLGHAPGRDAAVAYTHLNRLREHFGNLFEGEYGPVVEAVCARLKSD